MRTQRIYLTGPQLCERYGGVSRMWIWRRLNTDPRFPRPMVVAGRRFWLEAELDAWDELVKAETEAEESAA